MAYNEASLILASHGIEYRPSTRPDHIQALMIWVQAGRPGEAWEEVRMTRSAIRAWLGY